MRHRHVSFAATMRVEADNADIDAKRCKLVHLSPAGRSETLHDLDGVTRHDREVGVVCEHLRCDLMIGRFKHDICDDAIFVRCNPARRCTERIAKW